MCLEAAKSIPAGELLAYKLIARRKEDGVFVSPIQKSHVWNTNRVVVLDDSPEIWESSTDAKIGKGFIHTFSEEKPPMYQIIQTIKKFVGGRQEVTIPIREMISVVLPHLCRHEYCQPEHINPDKYKYDTGRIRYHSKEGTKMIAIRPRNQNDYIHIPYSVYKQIKEEDL